MVDVSGFAYSRLKRVGGVSIEVSLDPTKLTPRVRKAAQKMLRGKHIHGDGKAAKAALMAWASVTRPPALLRGGHYVLNYKQIPETVRGEWRNLHTTGRMVALAASDDSGWRRQYIKDNYENVMQALDKNDTGRESPNCYFGVYDYPDELHAQIVDAFTKDPTDMHKLELAAQMLDGTAPIRPNMDLLVYTI
jgi:hypothetical protein